MVHALTVGQGPLDDRLICVTLPASAWAAVFLSHLEWVLEAMMPDEIVAEDRPKIARQLLTLYEAARQGAPASMDAELTEQREMLDQIVRRLDYVLTPEDHALAARCVMREADLLTLVTSLVTRLAKAEGKAA